MTELYKATLEEAEIIGSLYRDICRCRDDLLGFLDRNDWFGQLPVFQNRKVLVVDFQAMQPAVRRWLQAYQRSDREKLEILFQEFCGIKPATCRLYRHFVDHKALWDEPSGWLILDFLLSSGEKEITSYEVEELDQLMVKTRDYLPGKAAKLLGTFITEYLLKDTSCYEISSRRIQEPVLEAYSMSAFRTMAYLVFNEESWEKNDLVIKALRSSRCSNLWLFIAFHFLGAIRQSDIIRLPIPGLPYPAQETRKRIKEECLTDQEALGIAEEFLYRLEFQPLRPSKTERYQGVPDIKLFIPESLKVPFGRILAIRLIHRKQSEDIVVPVTDLVCITGFFGTAFAEAIGHHRFQTRRANKAYLQGIELVTEDEIGKPKGYMLAALARSHKGGIGTLPEITDVYLRDAAFTGYRPEFILKEMFERGIFGFIPVMLLDRYTGGGFQRLDISGQTELIRMIGMDAGQLEELTSQVETALIKSKEIVAGIHEGELSSTLQRIANGSAVSKQDEILCLKTAMGESCCRCRQGSCIGCGYEIYTKAAFHLLIKEYVRLARKKSKLRGKKRIRISKIQSDGIVPAMEQMIRSIKILYPETDMMPMIRMMERGMKDAAVIERSDI